MRKDACDGECRRPRPDLRPARRRTPPTDKQLAWVLIVDDDARVRAAFHALLDHSDEFRCLAVDGHDALKLVTTRGGGVDFQVAIVDMSDARTVPAGLRLVALLVEQAPVVVVSMSGTARALALHAGAKAFVDKNGDAGALLAVIRLVARRGAGGGALPGVSEKRVTKTRPPPDDQAAVTW